MNKKDNENSIDLAYNDSKAIHHQYGTILYSKDEEK